MKTSIPLTNVGAGGIAGVLASVLMMILNHDVYNFEAVYALIFALVVAAAGYMVPKNKSFIMLVAAPVATLIAAAVGYIAYGVQWDNATVSVAFSVFVVALFGYLGPSILPDPQPDPEPTAAEEMGSPRVRRRGPRG